MIIDLFDFLPVRQKLKTEGKKLVFTNGVFDILHRGHVEYLTKAKDYGDVLIIGVNTDSSVRRLKGPKRPINTHQDRGFLLDSLKVVDYVIFFGEDTPSKLIAKILPDVLVKGADYKIHEIIGADVVLANGGQVRPIELTRGKSTSGMIEKIIDSYCK